MKSSRRLGDAPSFAGTLPPSPQRYGGRDGGLAIRSPDFARKLRRAGCALPPSLRSYGGRGVLPKSITDEKVVLDGRQMSMNLRILGHLDVLRTGTVRGPGFTRSGAIWMELGRVKVSQGQSSHYFFMRAKSNFDGACTIRSRALRERGRTGGTPVLRCGGRATGNRGSRLIAVNPG